MGRRNEVWFSYAWGQIISRQRWVQDDLANTQSPLTVGTNVFYLYLAKQWERHNPLHTVGLCYHLSDLASHTWPLYNLFTCQTCPFTIPQPHICCPLYLSSIQGDEWWHDNAFTVVWFQLASVRRIYAWLLVLSDLMCLIMVNHREE